MLLLNHWTKSAYLTLDHEEDKPAIGQPPRHSPIPVDPHSGVYTGLKEDEDTTEEEKNITEMNDANKTINDCENKIKDGPNINNSHSKIVEKTGLKEEWF